jgi:hypothetical protein
MAATLRLPTRRPTYEGQPRLRLRASTTKQFALFGLAGGRCFTASWRRRARVSAARAMTNDWLIPLITAGSGVGGAVVGASSAMWMHRRDAVAVQAREHRAALVALWKAVNSFAVMWQGYGLSMPKRQNWFTHAWHGIQVGGLASPILQRLWLVMDSVWDATGRFRAVATVEELEVLSAIEDVLSGWEIGEPLPEAWTPAVTRLRELVESQGPRR